MKLRYVAALCGAILSGVVVAGEVDTQQGFDVQLGAGRFHPDSDRELNNGTHLGLGGGYRFDENWGIEAWYLQSDFNQDGNKGDGDLRQFRVDALYHFLNGNWQPYVALGAADSNFSFDSASSQHTQQLNFGGGVKYFFNPSWFVRGDLRAFSGSAKLDTAATFSVGYMFGQKARASQDTDGDGVVNTADRCPNTPAGVAVDRTGCALDTDKDGVPDYLDECPDTEAGAKVDERGCYMLLEQAVSIRLDVAFASNSADLTAASRAEVEKLADFLIQYPVTSAVIEGHTDDMGSASYNQSLSERRAQAVVDMLVSDFDIDKSRLDAKGFGESKPIADNGSDEGRSKNRRVVTVIESTESVRQ